VLANTYTPEEAGMFAAKLVQLIETHADKLADGVMERLKSSPRCQELVQRVPPDELRKRAHEIYRNLTDWLLTKTESEIEERYIGLGIRRARQGVPFSDFLWAVSATKEYLWEYSQREGVMEEPVELWGEIELLHSLDRFFDSAIYFAAVGYESASEHPFRRLETAHAGGRKSRS
jgi:hypothetical protein